MIWTILIIAIATIFDAWRDAWINAAWWPRHVVKWVAFYVPLIYLLYKDGWFERKRLKYLPLLAAAMLIVWELVYLIMTKGN